MAIIGNGLRIQGLASVVSAFRGEAPSSESRLLLESGFGLLQENGSNLILDLGSDTPNLLMENGYNLLQENGYTILLD